MRSIIRRITLDDIHAGKHIDTQDGNQPAICILQCGRVSVPLSEQCFAELINSINEFTNEITPCNQCKYVCIDDRNVTAMSCNLKAMMSGVQDARLNRFNKKFIVNPLGSCQFAQPLNPQPMPVPNPKTKQQEDDESVQKRAVPSRLRRLPGG